tara:strand:+ start:72 stop:251 length:180 start_codon:yes stop_codon:yes gene_type:complete
MNQSFIISATVFTIIMVIFHIIKDVIIGKDISPELRVKVNKRWLISTGIGLFLLYLIYA